MLSFKERKYLQNLELTHGVIVKMNSENMLEAYRWQEDEPVVEAPTLRELEIVLKAMNIYAHSDEYSGNFELS